MKVKRILISQPEPADIEQSPYRDLANNYDVELTFFKFFDIVGISASEFRKNRIHLVEFTAVIFNSKNSVDHFFRMAKELRESIPETMKYFCSSESIALYLQNYIQYRKRKIFFGTQYFSDLIEVMSKHRDEKFIFPCSDEKQTEYTKMLDKAKFKYTKAPMYRAQAKDLHQFDLNEFDMLALFSPIGVRSLIHNFPDIKDHPIRIAAFGTSTHQALNAEGIKLTIAAPTKTAPSMAMAIENYINGKEQDSVVSTKTGATKSRSSHSKSSSSSTGTKKTKSVFTNKAKYKQLMEEKKAKSAARKAEREARKKAAEEAAANEQPNNQ